MEGRLVLSASGFAGNECAPELDNAALDAIVPAASSAAQADITFQFSAASVVSDSGVGATAVEDIIFALDPDIGSRDNGATPDGATLTLNDQGTAETTDDMWEFSWSPSETQVGRFRLFVVATDDGGTNNVPLSDVYSFELTIDDRPSVDLNGADEAGTGFGPVSFVEADNSVPVSIVDTDLSIQASNDQVASATVEILNPQADQAELLAVTADSALQVDTSTNGLLVISVVGGGTADKALFESALQTLTYNNTSDDPLETRTINVSINDGNTDSDVAVVTVNVEATNDQPDLHTVTDAPNAVVGEEYVLNLVATDPDGADLLVFRIADGPDGAVISPNGLPDDTSDNTIQVARGTDGFYRATISWTPTEAEGVAGEGLFTVVVTDTGGLSDPEFYEISIANQAPVANDDPTPQGDPLAVGEDAGDTAIGDILSNDSDPDGDTFTVNSVSAGGSDFVVGVAFTHPTSGAAILVAANGQVNYNPNGQFESLGVGETASDTFQYTIIDENGNESSQATVTVTIDGANDAPTDVAGVVPEFRISEAAGATVLDLATLLTAIADVDAGDTHSVSFAPTNPAEGGIFALDGDLTFDPNGDFSLASGAEETIDFKYRIIDSQGEPVDIPAKIIIEGGNDSPVAVADPGFSTDEDVTLTVDTREAGILANDTDDGGNAGLTVAQVDGDAANIGVERTVTDGSGREGALTVNADGTFTFVPSTDFLDLAVNQSSTVTFNYIATDSAAENSLSNEVTVTITIDGVNNAPTASSTSAAAVEGGSAVSGNFVGDDLDDGEAASLVFDIIQASLPTEGTVTNNDDGTFSFDPLDDFQDLAEGVTRDVTFNYTATDAQSAVSDEAIATITVTGVNDAPVFDLNNVDGLASVLPTGDVQSEGIVAVELNLASSDSAFSSIDLLDIPAFTSDPDGDGLTFSLASGNNGGAAFRAENLPVMDGSHRVSWTPDTPELGNTYVIRVVASDTPAVGTPLSSTFDLLVTVVNGPFVESVTTGIDTTLADSEVTILFNTPMGASAFDASNYSFEAVDGSLAGTAISVLSATANTAGDGVVLLLNDSSVNSVADPLAGGTKIKVTLDPAIVDDGGLAIAGLLEFEIDLVDGALI